MLQFDIFYFHRAEYIVIDTAVAAFDREGLARLASYRQGVGADRILLVDKSLGQLIAALDGKGEWQMVSAPDCQVARVAMGKADRPADMHYRELRITEYFLAQLLPVNDLKVAG